MKNPIPDIEHWWAVKAMIASGQGMHPYRRLGHHPLLYFSAFRPNGGDHE